MDVLLGWLDLGWVWDQLTSDNPVPFLVWSAAVAAIGFAVSWRVRRAREEGQLKPVSDERDSLRDDKKSLQKQLANANSEWKSKVAAREYDIAALKSRVGELEDEASSLRAELERGEVSDFADDQLKLMLAIFCNGRSGGGSVRCGIKDPAANALVSRGVVEVASRELVSNGRAFPDEVWNCVLCEGWAFWIERHEGEIRKRLGTQGRQAPEEME